MIKPTISIPAALLATLLLAAPFSTQAATYRFRTIDVPFSGAADSSAAGINDSGQIVGYYYDSSSEHGFLDENGTFTSIDDPNAKPDPNGWSDTRAYGINDSGQIVGHSTIPTAIRMHSSVIRPTPHGRPWTIRMRM